MSNKVRALLKALQDFSAKLNESATVDIAAAVTLDAAIELASATRGCLILTEEGRPEVVVARAAGNHSIEADFMILEPGDFTSNEMAISNTTLLFPMHVAGLLIGTLYLEGRPDQTGWGDYVVDFVSIVANQAALFFHKACLADRLKDGDKDKSEFISLVTHQLRIPLTSISGYTDLLRSERVGSLTEKQSEFLNKIRRNSDRMGILIQNLADINRIESGRQRFNRRTVTVEQTLSALKPHFEKEIAKNSQTLVMDIEPDLAPISADQASLNRILKELVSNATLYTPEKGSISIRARNNGPMVEIQVQDTGIGISDEDQKRLFTPFFRSELPAVRRHVGWGLALVLIKRLAEGQGGRLSCQSALGKGSTFTLSLPMATQALAG